MAYNYTLSIDSEMVQAIVKGTTEEIIKHLQALPRETKADGQ